MTDQEINEAVAIRMGWRKVPVAVINGRTYENVLWAPWMGDPMDPQPGAHAIGPPDYSGDVRAAWEILEALASSGTHWEMSKADSGYTVFIREGYYPYVPRANAPLAILRSAPCDVKPARIDERIKIV